MKTLLALPLLLSAFLVSCNTQAPPTAFLGDKVKLSKDGQLPFQRSFQDPKANFAKYQKVYIAPTNTEFTELNGLAMSGRNLMARKEDDIRTNGAYFQSRFREAFANSKTRKWQVVDQPSRDATTLIVEPALVQIGASKPIIGLAGAVVPGTGLINRPHAAMELRLKDARTGRIIAAAADRETPPISPYDFSKLQFYRPAQNIMKEWAVQTVRWVNRSGNEQVGDTFFFQPVSF